MSIDWKQTKVDNTKPLRDVPDEELEPILKDRLPPSQLRRFNAIPTQIIDGLINQQQRRKLLIILSSLGILFPVADIAMEERPAEQSASAGNKSEVVLSLFPRYVGDGSPGSTTLYTQINLPGTLVQVSNLPLLLISSFTLLLELLSGKGSKESSRKAVSKLFLHIRQTTNNATLLNELSDLEAAVTSDLQKLSKEERQNISLRLSEIIEDVIAQENNNSIAESPSNHFEPFSLLHASGSPKLKKLLDEVNKNKRDRTWRTILTVAALALSYTAFTDDIRGGVRPGGTLRSYYPPSVSNVISGSGIDRTIQVIWNYHIHGIMPELYPYQRSGDAVFTGDEYSPETVHYEGQVGRVELINDQTPESLLSGYFLYFLNSTPELETAAVSYEGLAGYNSQNTARYQQLIDPSSAYGLRINDLELAVNSNSRFARLLTRFPEFDESVSNPLVVGSGIEVYAVDTEGNRTELVENVDYTLLTNGDGFSAISFINGVSADTKYFANYTIHQVDSPANFVETQDPYFYQRFDQMLEAAYPDGVIDITDSDAAEAGVDYYSMRSFFEFYSELLDEAVYDINYDQGFATSFTETFIRAINSDELLELYCTNTAQAVMLVQHILASPRFQIRINGELVNIRLAGAARSAQIYIATGFNLTADTNGNLYRANAHAFNVVAANLQGFRAFTLWDFTPSRLSPDISDATRDLLRQQEINRQSNVPRAEAVSDSDDIHSGVISPQGSGNIDLTTPNIPGSIGILSTILLVMILTKVRFKKLAIKKLEFMQFFQDNRRQVAVRYITKRILAEVYGQEQNKVSDEVSMVSGDSLEEIFEILTANPRIKSRLIKAIDKLRNELQQGITLSGYTLGSKGNKLNEKYVIDSKEMRNWLNYLARVINSCSRDISIKELIPKATAPATDNGLTEN